MQQSFIAKLKKLLCKPIEAIFYRFKRNHVKIRSGLPCIFTGPGIQGMKASYEQRKKKAANPQAS